MLSLHYGANMRLKSLAKISVVLIIVAFIAALVWRWQMKQLSSALSMSVKPAENISIAALTELAIDPSAIDSTSPTSNDKPLLDQNLGNPAAVDHRKKLVTTWMHATALMNELSLVNVPVGKVIGSEALTEVAASNRDDAWGHQFCVFYDGRKVVVMSNGGNGQPHCDELQQVAKKFASAFREKKLVRAGGVFAVVRSNGSSATHDGA